MLLFQIVCNRLIIGTFFFRCVSIFDTFLLGIIMPSLKEEKLKIKYHLENNKPRYNKEKTVKPM